MSSILEREHFTCGLLILHDDHLSTSTLKLIQNNSNGVIVSLMDTNYEELTRIKVRFLK